MNSKLPLAGIQVKNFKAVQDSKVIRFTPLTVFIGNNGSGKTLRHGEAEAELIGENWICFRVLFWMLSKLKR